jgi:N6-L-threonylcarbamoyladenine synthase
VARAFVDAVVDVLAAKSRAALRATQLARLVVAGGVGANRQLRARLGTASAAEGFELFFPPLDLCTDNGAMIARAGLVRLRAGQRSGPGFSVHPRWPLAQAAGSDAGQAAGGAAG